METDLKLNPRFPLAHPNQFRRFHVVKPVFLKSERKKPERKAEFLVLVKTDKDFLYFVQKLLHVNPPPYSFGFYLPTALSGSPCPRGRQAKLLCLSLFPLLGFPSNPLRGIL